MAYSYMDEWWQNRGPEFKDWIRRSAITWRREPVIKRVPRPTNLTTARRLGYKAKPGIAIVRIRIRRGGARKPRPVSGRRQKAMGSSKFTRAISIQKMAERRVARRYPNMTVRNSYHLFSDSTSHWFEVILVDYQRPGLETPYIHRKRRHDSTVTTPVSQLVESEPKESEEPEDND